MKLRIVGGFVTLFLLLALSVCVETARADHQVLFGDATYGLYDAYNPAIKEMRLTGVHRWRYVQEASGRDILPAVLDSLNEYSREFDVWMVHDGAGGWRQIASGGVDFIYGNSEHGACGTWAIGCVPDFLTAKQSMVYDSVSMVAWSRNSQVEVVNHETGHFIGNFAEAYKESYVYGATECPAPTTPARASFMSCGLSNAAHVDGYIREAWSLSHHPPKPKRYGIDVVNGLKHVSWCNEDYLSSRAALMAWNPATGSYRWTGAHVLPDAGSDRNADGFFDAGACRRSQAYEQLLRPGEVICLNRENAISWQRSSWRGDVCVW